MSILGSCEREANPKMSKTIGAAAFKATCLRVIKQINRDGESVVVTRHGRPVAVVSPAPADAESPLLVGAMRGSVLGYDDPFEPAADPADWDRTSLIVLDTHVLVRVVDGSRRLGATARDRVNQAARAGGVGLSAITPWEVALLAERGRLRLGRDVAAWLDEALALPGLRLIPIDPSIAVASVGLPGDLGADPADCFIVATARHLGVPLVTADRAVLAYGRQGHVRVLDARC